MKGVSVLENPYLPHFFRIIQAVRLFVMRVELNLKDGKGEYLITQGRVTAKWNS